MATVVTRALQSCLHSDSGSKSLILEARKNYFFHVVEVQQLGLASVYCGKAQSISN